MIKESSVSEMNKLKIPRQSRVLVNRGRGNDELAPAEELYREMMSLKAGLEATMGKASAEAHNRAYRECDFERRFREQVTSDTEAMERLRAIAKRAEGEDIYLVCYEGPTKACHRRILMRMAEQVYGSVVEVRGVEPT